LAVKPVIKGTRIQFILIIELLGKRIDGKKKSSGNIPTLTKEDIKAALLYASKCVENEETITL